MKTIIAGGRDYTLTADDFAFLDTLTITEVFSGAARGADRDGEIWAEARGIPVRLFPAEWHLYGKLAGPRRNLDMASEADAVVLFPGGKGTRSMMRIAKQQGLIIHDRTHA